MNSEKISQLSARLQQESSDYKPGDERQRQKLLATSAELAKAIETPSERLARMCYVEIYLFVTARILIDLDVFVCTQGFVREVGPDEYVASGLTDKIA
jgi:hypothetical protein